MDFEKVKLEELKEQILLVEDFDNIDEALLSEINKNDELQRLLEEVKALSVLVGDCTPSPSKDGVTLHDAVMKRVREGDTTPRYIFKRKYPIATAACLLVCMAVVLVARNGFGNFAEKEAFDAAAPETEMLSDSVENGVVDYKIEIFSLDEVADEEASLTADAVKFKSAMITAQGNAEFQAAPTEAVPEAEEYEAVTDSSTAFDDGVNTAVYDKSDSTLRWTVSGGGGAASEGAVMFSTPYGDELSEEIITEEPLRTDVFLYEGRSYTVSEIFEMYKAGELTFDINSDEFDDVWRVCLAAVSENDDSELIRFIKDNYEKSIK